MTDDETKRFNEVATERDRLQAGWYACQQDLEKVVAERDAMRRLLDRASNTLAQHHEASVWDQEHARKHNYTCPFCTKPTNIFQDIEAATQPQGGPR